MARKVVYTSSFSGQTKIPPDVHRFSISQGQPKWIQPPLERIEWLAPSWDLVKIAKSGKPLARETYDVRFRHQLESKDANHLYAVLPERSVLLCWCGPNVWCHRRIVAEWMERELGIEVPEWGLIRRLTPDYDELGDEETGPKQGSLF